ncbi:MAG TPA: hypothetical protein VK636_11450 [Gemmatimonadaceae bacterium]|nr:hypothetical protein [Gemmatimonadaceae bacterium]
MRSRLPLTLTAAAVAGVLGLSVAAVPAHGPSVVTSGVNPHMQSIGPLAIGQKGILYAADPQAATIVALDLSKQPKGTPGTKDIDALDQKIAATLGTAASEITISDLKVDHVSYNSYVSVMRGQGANASPALLRIDGAGKIDVIALDGLEFSSVALPNAPDANPTSGRSNRNQSITNLAFSGGKVYVAGLSNEEFASKLWAVAYPFKEADRGASVEIFHGSHGQVETRSPVYTFVPYTVGGEATLIAAYLCTPLVKFPVSSLTPGAKVRGTTIAELGAGNRPIDMVVYKKDGGEFLLMSNTSRGVMKIPTKDFATQAGITTPIQGTAGIAYETIKAMTGIQQLDLLDADHSIVVAKGSAGGLNLQTVALP